MDTTALDTLLIRSLRPISIFWKKRTAKSENIAFWPIDTFPSLVEPPEPETFLRVVCLGNHLQALPAELRQDYVSDVARACGEPLELDYVRLNILARRGQV